MGTAWSSSLKLGFMYLNILFYNKCVSFFLQWILSFVVAEKKGKTGCFQSKNADEDACVAVKIEHSRGRQHHLHSPYSHLPPSCFTPFLLLSFLRSAPCKKSLSVRSIEKVCGCRGFYILWCPVFVLQSVFFFFTSSWSSSGDVCVVALLKMQSFVTCQSPPQIRSRRPARICIWNQYRNRRFKCMWPFISF